MSKSDCSREYQYLVKTSKHHLAHSQEQVEKDDPSCEICWPVQRGLIENTNQPFAIFWKSILQPRSEGGLYTFQTIQIFEQLQKTQGQQQARELIEQLIQTIRYPGTPPLFESLIESLLFYWRVTSQFQNTIFKKMSGLTEDSSKSSSDTTTTIEDEQLKENTESNENESQRNNKEAKNKKKENNEGYTDSSNLHIRDTSENPIGNSKSISSSSTSPLQYRPSFRYNDLYDEPSITVPRDFSFSSRYGLHDEGNDQNKSKSYSGYQRKSNFGSSIRSSTPKQSLNQSESQSSSSSKFQPSNNSYTWMNPLLNIAGQATQNSGSTPNWVKDLNPQEQSIFELVAKAKEYFDRSAEPRETRLVDFPEFKGGNQDPVEWLEAFERACDANKVPENRKVILVASYLKGTALTWYNRANIQNWNNPLYRPISFVHAFTDYFCNPFKLNQWKHQLRNRKQKPGETIEDYIAAIEELWKRVDPQGRRTELDKIHEFIEGLRPEFIVPVQSAMPETAEEAMDRARALETALSLNMELSAYSLIPDYLQNMNGGMIPAKTNMTMFQPTYTATQQAESIEKIVERKISEGIAAALGQIRTESKPYQNNQGRNSGCYLCGKPGHIAKNCRQRSFQNNGNNSNNNNNNQRNNNNNRRNIECYNCGRKGHI
ncbi:hypothetical protein RclHR1_06420001, partial [Rhizophagus clarus]